MARTGGNVQAARAVEPELKPVYWVNDSRRTIREFPDEVQKEIGVALFWAQKGDKHPDAKALRGFGDAQVVEVVENHDGDTYRAVYTTRISKVIYVLHCFQKKSKKGDKTPAHDIELIKRRLSKVEELSRQH